MSDKDQSPLARWGLIYLILLSLSGAACLAPDAGGPEGLATAKTILWINSDDPGAIELLTDGFEHLTRSFAQGTVLGLALFAQTPAELRLDQKLEAFVGQSDRRPTHLPLDAGARIYGARVDGEPIAWVDGDPQARALFERYEYAAPQPSCDDLTTINGRLSRFELGPARGSEDEGGNVSFIYRLGPDDAAVGLDDGHFFEVHLDATTSTATPIAELTGRGLQARGTWVADDGRIWLGGDEGQLWIWDRAERSLEQVIAPGPPGNIRRLEGRGGAEPELWAVAQTFFDSTISATVAQPLSAFVLELLWSPTPHWRRYLLRDDGSSGLWVDLAYVEPGRVLATADVEAVLEIRDHELSALPTALPDGAIATALLLEGTGEDRRLTIAGSIGTGFLGRWPFDATTRMVPIADSHATRIFKLAPWAHGTAAIGSGGWFELGVEREKTFELCGVRPSQRQRNMFALSVQSPTEIWFGGGLSPELVPEIFRYRFDAR